MRRAAVDVLEVRAMTPRPLAKTFASKGTPTFPFLISFEVKREAVSVDGGPNVKLSNGVVRVAVEASDYDEACELLAGALHVLVHDGLEDA